MCPAHQQTTKTTDPVEENVDKEQEKKTHSKTREILGSDGLSGPLTCEKFFIL